MQSSTMSAPSPSPSNDHPFIKAVDDIASKTLAHGYQYGKNNHVEYKGVTTSLATLQEKVMQFSFQLVRTSSETGLSVVANDTREILNIIMSGIKTIDKSSDDYKRCVDMGVIMFKLLAQTRDIIGGKGEYMLFYVMLLEWAKVDFRFFEYVIETLVYDTQDTGDSTDTVDAKSKQHPLGSWKDMKYFLTYMKEQSLDNSNYSLSYNVEGNSQLYPRLVNKIVNLINEQLRIDAASLENGGTSFSLVARWVPREKSKKFGWLYYYLATNYSQHQIPSDSSHPSYERAVNRAFMIYRKVISSINKKLDTTQVKQCGGKWSEINFDNVTSITMHKQTNSFLNLNKNGKTMRCENDEDRNNCKDNYEAYLRDVVDGNNKIKGKNNILRNFPQFDHMKYCDLRY